MQLTKLYSIINNELDHLSLNDYNSSLIIISGLMSAQLAFFWRTGEKYPRNIIKYISLTSPLRQARANCAVAEWDAANEYPQHRFIWRTGENYLRIILKCSSLTLSTLSKNFSRQHFEIFFLSFPEKQDLNNGDNLHEMSNPVFWEN